MPKGTIGTVLGVLIVKKTVSSVRVQPGVTSPRMGTSWLGTTLTSIQAKSRNASLPARLVVPKTIALAAENNGSKWEENAFHLNLSVLISSSRLS